MNNEEILSLMANIAQLVAFCIMVWEGFSLWRAKRELERKMLSLGGTSELSKRPIAIAIGIGNNPLISVENFLKDQKMDHIEILSYIFPGYLQPDQYFDAMVNINKLKDNAQDLGVSEVLLFYSGPVELAIHTGASFGNWVPIKLFALTKDKGTYEYKATLTRETARMDSLADQLTRKLEGLV